MKSTVKSTWIKIVIAILVAIIGLALLGFGLFALFN